MRLSGNKTGRALPDALSIARFIGAGDVMTRMSSFATCGARIPPKQSLPVLNSPAKHNTVVECCAGVSPETSEPSMLFAFRTCRRASNQVGIMRRQQLYLSESCERLVCSLWHSPIASMPLTLVIYLVTIQSTHLRGQRFKRPIHSHEYMLRLPATSECRVELVD